MYFSAGKTGHLIICLAGMVNYFFIACFEKILGTFRESLKKNAWKNLFLRNHLNARGIKLGNFAFYDMHCLFLASLSDSP